MIKISDRPLWIDITGHKTLDNWSKPEMAYHHVEDVQCLREDIATLVAQVADLTNDWIPCNDWKDLPIGTWLVKVDKDRKPYNVAEVSEADQGSQIIIVGNYFHWDMGECLAYTSFTPYKEVTDAS